MDLQIQQIGESNSDFCVNEENAYFDHQQNFSTQQKSLRLFQNPNQYDQHHQPFFRSVGGFSEMPSGGFQCSICSYQTKFKSYILRHLPSHTKEKPFKCNICHAAFSQKNNLNVHMRTHTGERPYQCPFCQESFTYSSHLKPHMLRIHWGM